MIFNFRKIASVLSSAVMVSSTMALAAASSFPAPFVQSGAADVAVVYGADAATTDLIAAVDIQSALSTELARQTASSGSTSVGTVTGEATPLFTSGTKIYINDSLSVVKNVLVETDLPNVLKEGSFSGNVDASFTQQIDIGSDPRVTFKKQPTSTFEPAFGLTVSTDTDQKYLYNATVIFSKEVNLSHADSEGEDISIFGTTYTISSSTTATDLVLLKSAEKLSLSSDDPVAEAVIAGATYTIELVSASDSAATIKVTNAAGVSENKEVSESNSKKINGITIAVTNADETNLKLSASIVAGADKITLTDNNNVKFGEEDTIVDGTEVHFEGAANGITSLTKLIVAAGAADSDTDAILAGATFTDPVFGSFKLDFAGLNIADDSTTAREEIKIVSSGDDKMQVSFTDYDGNEKTINFARNVSSGDGNQSSQEGGHSGVYNSTLVLQYDDDGHNISVQEGKILVYGDYAVVGNEDDGRIVRLSSVKNASESTKAEYSNDRVEFADVMSGDTYKATLTADGTGTVSIKGKQYGVKYWGASGSATEDFNVTLDYPDSTGNQLVVYPTIQTKKGAKLSFYVPVIVNLTNFRDTGKVVSSTLATFGTTNVSAFLIPDGDGYTTVTVSTFGGNAHQSNYSVDAGAHNITNFTAGGSAGTSVVGYSTAVANLRYNFTMTNEERAEVYLVSSADTASNPNLNIKGPALVIFEEKDDNNEYQAQIITLEEGGNGDDGVGVEDVVSTWVNDSAEWSATTPADSNIEKRGTLWGTIATIDSGDSDQKQATLSYPDEQIYAQVYIGENSATISAGTTGSGSVTSLGNVLVTDAEASSVSSKNLIVVGGSCINSVAADLLGAGACGADFESTTGVGAGSFLIETFSRSSGKVATLVAGYNAGDTTNAAKYLTTQTVDTTAGKKYKGTSATSAELVTSTA